jgi:hypothetical protein
MFDPFFISRPSCLLFNLLVFYDSSQNSRKNKKSKLMTNEMGDIVDSINKYHEQVREFGIVVAPAGDSNEANPVMYSICQVCHSDQGTIAMFKPSNMPSRSTFAKYAFKNLRPRTFAFFVLLFRSSLIHHLKGLHFLIQS